MSRTVSTRVPPAIAETLGLTGVKRDDVLFLYGASYCAVQLKPATGRPKWVELTVSLSGAKALLTNVVTLALHSKSPSISFMASRYRPRLAALIVAAEATK